MAQKDNGHYSELPQPPEVKKRLRFTRSQMIGMPILFLTSLLALFGVFDHASTQQVRSTEALQVTVEYPTRFNYNQSDRIEIHMRNLSAASIPTMTVGVDAAYLRAFSDLQFTPAVAEVQDDWFRVHFNEVGPGERYRLLIEFRSQRIGPSTGRIRIEPDGAEAVEVEVSTLILP